MPLGPGAIDAQGIWIYGEDDDTPLASDLLNFGQSSTSTQIALVRADIANLADPPDTDWRTVMPATTTTVPEGEAKYNTAWSGESSSRFQLLAFRVRGGHVYITGAAKRTGPIAVDDVMLVLPPNARPTRSLYIPVVFAGASTFFHIQPSGAVCVGAAVAAATVHTVIMSTSFPAAL